LVNKKEQKYLFQGVLLEFIDFAHDTGICSFCYDAFKIDNILNINLENCLTYIPLYSTEPMCLSKQKTEFELIEEELDLWLTNPAEFFDKKIAGNIKYL
jgi:hypothetical protein